MNYYQFSAEDFAADDYFKEWVCTPDSGSDIFWEAFLRDYPEKYYAVQEGRELVTGLGQMGHSKNHDEQVTKIWQRIENSVAGHQKHFQLGRRRALVWKVAATIALLFAMAWLADGKLPKPIFTANRPAAPSGIT